MKPLIPRLCLTLFALTLLGSVTAHAATFVVDIVIDDAQAHDATPGDGICADALGSCPLRAAIEEANARAGTDTILFADGFINETLVLSATEGPLPVISGRVFILGQSIDAYNSAASLLRDAPPQFFISGENLGSTSQSGLVFSTSAASGSLVSAIGIVNFPGSGIVSAFGADDIIVERCYVGVLANGAPAGNGIHGFHAAASDGHRIGKDRNADNNGFLGLGNVFSSNGQSGIRLESSSGSILRGNLIGIRPAGSSDRGNGGYGIHITGSNNDIGDFVANASAGNFIAGNDLGGIHAVGNGNSVFANTLGIGETGSFISSEADGVVIIGSNNLVGTGGRGRNRIVEHQGSAIRLGVLGGSSADGNFIINNEIGSAGSQFPLLYSSNGAGISVRNGDDNAILNNICNNSVGTAGGPSGNGIEIRGSGNAVHGNQLGFINGINGPLAEPNQQGLSIIGPDNLVGTAANPNQIGGNAGVGMLIQGSGNQIRSNFVGVTSTLAKIGNVTSGIVLQNGDALTVSGNVIGDNSRGILINNMSNTAAFFGNWIGIAPDGRDIGNRLSGIELRNSSNSDFQLNRIAFNGGAGIETDGNVSGIAVFQNRMHDNAGLGFDLNGDGPTPNDPGDIDEGPNRLQNTPLIESVILDSIAVPPTLTISYRVDSNTDVAGYPLFIDFYWSNLKEPAQGRFFLGTDFNYSVANALRTVTLDFMADVDSGWVTATALDQGRNSSEFAEHLMFGAPRDLIFADGFE